MTGLSNAAIGGIVTGIVVTVAGLAYGVWRLCRSRKEAKSRERVRRALRERLLAGARLRLLTTFQDLLY